MSFEAMQGNRYIELLSTSNKDLVNQWKMHNSIQKEYDSLSKTYVYNVDGKSPSIQMCLPKDKKQRLRLYFPLLVLQICFPVKANILCNIGVTLCNNQRKRITLSSNQKTKQHSSLFTVLPLSVENSNKWVNILIDVEEIVSTVWSNLKLKEIDCLSLSGVFRLKRVFLLTRDLIHSSKGIFIINYDQLPKQMSLPKNVLQHYVYVSSSYITLPESLKASHLGNEDVYDENSSKSSSKCSSRVILDNEKTVIPQVKSLAASDINKKIVSKYFEVSEGSDNDKKYDGTFDLNLSMLTFLESPEIKSFTDLYQFEHKKKTGSCSIDLDTSTTDTLQNIE